MLRQFLAFCAIILFCFSAWAECPPAFVLKWGTEGDGNGQFKYPHDIAVDDSQYVYVTDVYNDRVQKFTSEGVFITSWGDSGSANGQFDGPCGIAVDDSGYVYVVDSENYRVQKFTRSGTFITKWGSGGAGDGQFVTAVGIAVDDSGHVYVIDSSTARIQKFTSKGEFITGWEVGTYLAEAIAVSDRGYVYVADWWDDCVRVFTSDGTFLFKWGTSGSGNGQFNIPRGIAIDHNGYVYVTDWTNNCVQKFSYNAAFIARWGSTGTGDGQFEGPIGIAVCDTGDVYVVEEWNCRIQRFNVPDNSDTDGDGLCNAWEVHGIDVDCDQSIDYVLADADPQHKDLYIEVDAMQGLAPSRATLNMVVDAFASAPNNLLDPPNPDSYDGINLHIDLDETTLVRVPWSSCGWPGGGWPDFESTKAAHFGTPTERGDPLRIEAKKKVYRYCIFIDQFEGAVSGAAEDIGCNDFVVSLGHPDWQPVSPEDQAGTFMHELGHALGLDHGGIDDVIWKPNYASVMNYLWQVPNRNKLSGPDSLALELYRESWELTYSSTEYHLLQEDALDERESLGGKPGRYVPVGPPCGAVIPTAQIVPMDAPVDWDRDGIMDVDPVCADANFIPGMPTSTPSPFDWLWVVSDWSLIWYLPNESSAWSEEVRPAVRLAQLQELTFEIVDSLSTLRFDCNGNGIPDGTEIENGTLQDYNLNGIPDICERFATGTKDNELPSRSQLTIYSYPNPFNPFTTIEYSIPNTGTVVLKIFDVKGRLLRTLVNEIKTVGEHRALWDGRDVSGALVASGIYFVRLETGGKFLSRKVVLIR